MASTYVQVNPVADSTPGFSYGRQGSVSSGTYLQIDGVPSNLSGRIVPFETAELYKIFVVTSDDATFDLDIQKRSGMTFTTIYTANIVGQRVSTFAVEDVEFVLGDEICVVVSSGTANNIVVGLIIKGN